MHRPDPTKVRNKISDLTEASQDLRAIVLDAISALIELEEYEGDLAGMKAIDERHTHSMDKYKWADKTCRVADLVGASAMREYAVDAIEYQSDLLERIVQLLEASHEG